MDRDKIDSLLQLCSKPVAFHPALARVLGDIGAALFLQQIIFWSDKGSRQDGWIYKTDKEIEDETTLTRRMCVRIRKLLRERNFLLVKVMQTPKGIPTNHYKVNARRVLKCIMDVHQMSISSTESTSEKKAFPSTGNAPRLPRRRKTYKTLLTNKILNHFSEECKKHIGVTPTLAVRDHRQVTYAMNSGGLTEAQIYDLFEEWFGLGKSDEETLSLTRALSRHQIDGYKARNGVKQ